MSKTGVSMIMDKHEFSKRKNAGGGAYTDSDGTYKTYQEYLQAKQKKYVKGIPNNESKGQ